MIYVREQTGEFRNIQRMCGRAQKTFFTCGQIKNKQEDDDPCESQPRRGDGNRNTGYTARGGLGQRGSEK